MQIFVTGGTGFIGQYVVRQLVASGHEVTALARRNSDLSRLKGLKLRIVYGDLSQPAILKSSIDEADVLINIAATMNGPKEEFETATVNGTKQLFELLKGSRVKRVVHVSSIAVLSMSGSRGSGSQKFEDNPYMLTPYVSAKQKTELIASEITKNLGIESFILRPGIVFGPGGTWKLPRIGYPNGNRFFVIGRGENRLPSSYVENVADAIVGAATKTSAIPGIYNVIDDDRITQNEYINKYAICVNPRLHIYKVPFIVFFLVFWFFEGFKRIINLPNPFQLGHIVGSYRQVEYVDNFVKKNIQWQPLIGKQEALNRTMSSLTNNTNLNESSTFVVNENFSSILPKITVGIVGCGIIADQHMKFLRSINNVEVTACCDPNHQVVQEFANKWKISKCYTDLESLLKNSLPKSIHLLTPPQFTHNLAQLAISHGCNLFIEKPFTINSFEARQVFSAAKLHKVIVCVDHNHTLDEVMIKALNKINNNELGEITWVDSYYGFDLGSNRENRLMRPDGINNWTFELPGGLFQNLLPHPLSTAISVIGQPTKVLSHARTFRVVPHQPHDELRVLLGTEKAGGLVTVSLASSPRSHTLTVYGTKGTIHVDFSNKTLVKQAHFRHLPKSVSRVLMNVSKVYGELRGTILAVLKNIVGSWIHFDGMQELIKRYYKSIEFHAPSPILEDDAIDVISTMDQVWEQIGSQDIFSVENKIRNEACSQPIV